MPGTLIEFFNKKKVSFSFVIGVETDSRVIIWHELTKKEVNNYHRIILIRDTMMDRAKVTQGV